MTTEKSAEDNWGQVRSVITQISDLQHAYYAGSPAVSRSQYIYRRLLPTAALQLQPHNYDAVVGIVKGGANLPQMLQPLGQNTGYLEWHRHWKLNPVWRVQKQAMETRREMRILLCENDARTGSTLQKVLRRLDTLSPASVDVCFTGEDYETSYDIADRMNGFSQIMHITDFRQDKIFSDMLEYRRKLEAVLTSE